MKFTLTLLVNIFLAVIIHCYGQNIEPDSPIPIDKTIIKGKLKNGLTYYIKHTGVTENAASYYLIQNVGSILENKDQRGLAHFLEHMAFNGTEHFPDKNILEVLEKHGAVFGKDINAYTSFNETVYNLNKIPVKDGLVDTCLTILSDWSNYLSLKEEEIDAERAVIKEEWRSRQSGGRRLQDIFYPVIYNNAGYADRMPIGVMSVVENFDYKDLRDFYHDWYRTDLQAVVVIGDVDAEKLEQKIISKFSSIPIIENPKKRFEIEIPDHPDMMYSIGMDPEVSKVTLSFGIRHSSDGDLKTFGDLKQTLLQKLSLSMLSSRISELARNSDASFLGASIGYSPLTRKTDAFKVTIYPKVNQQFEAFNEVFTEVIKAVKFGYTISEIERAKRAVISSYENAIARKDDRSHAVIERIIQNNFLNNTVMSDMEGEFEMVKKLFDILTVEDFNQTIKNLYTSENRYLNVTGVKEQDNLSFEKARKILRSLEMNGELQPYEENIISDYLLSDLNVATGKVVKTETNESFNSTTFTLSNGVIVHHKFTDKQKDRVSLRALSYGGKSLLKNSDLPSAGLVTALVSRSGVVNYNATEMRKILTGKTAGLKIGLGEISESFSGSSSSKDVDVMLQMLYAYFVAPRFDKEAFTVIKNNVDDYLISRKNNIRETMKDSLIYTIYGENHPQKRIFNQSYADDISFEKIKSIFKDRFSDISDFEFFIVGDIEKEPFQLLLENYIAGIPSKGLIEQYVVNSPEWISDSINKDIYLKMENPKSTVQIRFEELMPYSKENVIYTKALGRILQLRITEIIRELEGGAYSPRASAGFTREPQPHASVSFSFDCNPDMVEKLVNIVHEEFRKISMGDIDESELNKIKNNFIKEREQSINSISHEMRKLLLFYRYNEDVSDSTGTDLIIQKMNKDDIGSIAKRIKNDGKKYQVIFKPAEKKSSTSLK